MDDGSEPVRAQPNVLQTEAIRSSSNAVLLIASPGTGKTRVIRARVAYLLGRGVAVSSILVVTFTQHAAQHLRVRVGAQSGTSMEGIHLGTFHSICSRMLRRHAPLLGLSPRFVVLSDSEQLALLRSIMGHVGMKSAVGSGSSVATAPRILQRIQCWKESGLRPDEVPVDPTDDTARAARSLYAEYQRRLRMRGALDYAELTLGALKLLQQFPQVRHEYRQRYRHILVDELQDTSALQYEWLRLLSSGGDGESSHGPAASLLSTSGSSIFCAADDDQSVYGWRGAVRENVLRFQSDWPRADVYRMAQTYRCSPHILASALPLLEHACSLVPKSPFTTQPTMPAARVLLRGFWDSAQEGAWIASQIRSRLLTGQSPLSIAVLVRSQEQAKALLPHLMRAGLPVATQPVGAVEPWWSARDVQGAIHALRLVRSTADDEAARALLHLWAGVSASTLDGLERLARTHQHSLLHTAARALKQGRMDGTVASRLGFFLARYAHWQQLARTGGFAMVLRQVCTDHSDWSTSGGSAMHKLRHLAQRCGSLQLLLSHIADTGHGGAAAAGESHRTAAPAPGAAANGAQAGVFGGGAISLLTIHRSKGLEWDTVFLPGWEQGTFPLKEEGMPPGRMDEEWRLAYVALTRARRFAGITHASRRQLRGRWLHRAPSAFLRVLPSSSIASFAPNEVSPYRQGQSAFRASAQAIWASARAREHAKSAASSASAPALREASPAFEWVEWAHPPAHVLPSTLRPAVEVHAAAAHSPGVGAVDEHVHVHQPAARDVPPPVSPMPFEVGRPPSPPVVLTDATGATASKAPTADRTSGEHAHEVDYLFTMAVPEGRDARVASREGRLAELSEGAMGSQPTELEFTWKGHFMASQLTELEFTWERHFIGSQLTELEFTWEHRQHPPRQQHRTLEFEWIRGTPPLLGDEFTEATGLVDYMLDGEADPELAAEPRLQNALGMEGYAAEEGGRAEGAASVGGDGRGSVFEGRLRRQPAAEEAPALSSVWRDGADGRQVLTFVWTDARNTAYHLDVPEGNVATHLPEGAVDNMADGSSSCPRGLTEEAPHEAAALLNILVEQAGAIAAAQHDAEDWV